MGNKRTISALLWSAIGQVGATGIYTIFVLILARLVSPEDFGLFAICTLIVSLSIQLSGLGIATALIQCEKLDENVFSAAFWISGSSAVILFLCVTILAEPISLFFSASELARILPIMAIAIVLTNITNVYSALLRRAMNMKALANRAIAANIIGGLFAIPLALGGYGVYALVVQFLIVAVISLLLTALVARQPVRFRLSIDSSKDLIRYGVPVMKADLLSVLNMESPKFFIGIYLGPTFLGVYSMANRLLNLLLMVFATTLSSVVFPLLSEANRKNGQKMKEIYKNVMRLAALVFIPVFLIISVSSKELVEIVLGDQWAAAVNVTAVLCLAGIPISLGYINGAVAMAVGKTDVRYKSILTGTIIGTFALSIMTPFGLVWGGAAFLLRAILSESILFNKILPVVSISKYEIYSYLRVPVLGGLWMVLLMLLLKSIDGISESLYGILFAILSGGLMYSVIVCIFDRRVIKDLIKFVTVR